jgi:hypothetical protein
MSGERLTVRAESLCHVALVGATGGGKSNALRLILPQLQAIGAQVFLADPHYAAIDPESGEDWRPITARLAQAPATGTHDIAGLLAYLTEELDRRRMLRQDGQRPGRPMILAYDELPLIIDTVADATSRIGRILREGRKHRMYVVGASQSMLVKVVGGDSSARDAYRTAIYVGGDLRSASALLDLPQREIDDGQLGAGIAYVRSARTSPAQLVRIPLADNAGISAMLAASSPASSPASNLAVGSGLEAGLEAGAPGIRTRSAEDARILALARSGSGISDIVSAIYGVRGGSRYAECSAAVMRVLVSNLED